MQIEEVCRQRRVFDHSSFVKTWLRSDSQLCFILERFELSGIAVNEKMFFKVLETAPLEFFFQNLINLPLKGCKSFSYRLKISRSELLEDSFFSERYEKG